MNHEDKNAVIYQLQDRLDKLEHDYENLVEQIRLANQQRYGRHTESLADIAGQLSFDMQYIIEKPKTESGGRFVPMSEEVEQCFRRIIKNRPEPTAEPIIDGKIGFLFLDKNDRPMVALHWEKYFQHICEKYNSIYKIQMPKVTPHVCRHTFCSKMASSGMNPKMLQYIMGHSDISVTMNTYTHVTFDDAKDDFLKAINE